MRSQHSLGGAALAASLLLVPACSNGETSSSSTSAPGTGEGTSSQVVPTSTTKAAPSVTKPAADAFSVCDTRQVAKDAKGLSYCRTAAHEIPAGSPSLTCLGSFATVPAANARLKVTYSVYTGGRNVAYFRNIDSTKYTVKDFQVRYDFVPTDALWWGMKTLPPGSYYCEWYDANGAKLGEKDLVHGTLPSSTIGTPGAPI